MSLYKQWNPDPDTRIGIWKVEETEEALLAKLQLSAEERRFIFSIRHAGRRQQWLASRVCLRELLQTDDYIELATDEFGKPFLRALPLHISLSHIEGYAAVIVHHHHAVGIDLDRVEARVGLLAHKFLREEEMEQLHPAQSLRSMTLAWCAKEALYKWHGRRRLDFRAHLRLGLERDMVLRESGVLTGQVEKETLRVSLPVHYCFLQDLCLAWVAGPHPGTEGSIIP